MKFLRGLLLYAAVIFVGGTMQQVMTIPYQNPIKDGHEFTRDLMAGVVQKAAIEDVFAGIPMFQRYDNVFNFQDAVSSDLSKITDNAVVKYDYNKVREIAWLPALSFSAQAGELEQYNFSHPVELFEVVEDKEYIINHPEGSGYDQPLHLHPIGVGHTKNKTFVFFENAHVKYEYVVHYLDEETGEFKSITWVDRYPELVGGNAESVFNYKDQIFLVGDKGVTEFHENGSLTHYPMFSGIITTDGVFWRLRDGNKIYDIEREMIVDASDEKYQQARMLYPLLGQTARFGGRYVHDLVKLNPKTNPEIAAKEIALTKELLSQTVPFMRLTYENGTGELSYNTETGTFWAAIGGFKREDTGVFGAHAYSYDSSPNDTGAFGKQDARNHNFIARSHNFLYYGMQKFIGYGKPPKYVVRKIQIRKRYDDKGRDRFVYGNQKYIERGRPWQQTN